MIYKMTLTDSSDTMTFNLLETPIVDKDIEGAVDNVTLDGNQYTDYLYLKKQYIQKWAIMCPDEYDELRGFYTRQFEEGEIPSYRVYYGANVTKDYIYNGDYFQFNAKGIETGMYLSQLTGNAEQTTYSGKNLLPILDGTTTFGNLTFTVAEGELTINGTSNTAGHVKLTNGLAGASSIQASWLSETMPATDLNGKTISLDYDGGTPATSSCAFRIYGSTSTHLAQWYPSTTDQKTTFSTSNTPSCFAFFFNSGVSFTNYKLKIQLETGSAQTSFEKYVGGTPAPNPQFPQPISTVTGEQVVKVVGKNLCEGLNVGYYDISSKALIDTSSTRFRGFKVAVDSGTYTLSCNTKINVVRAFTDYDNSSNVIFSGTQTNINSFTMNVTQATTLYLSFRRNDNTDWLATDLIQLELGSTATAYEPYQGEGFEINLGKNLFDKSDTSLLMQRYISGSGVLTNSASDYSIYIPCEPNTTYTIQKGLQATTAKNRFRIGTCSTVPTNGTQLSDYWNAGDGTTTTSHTITTNASAKYLVVFCYTSDTSTIDDMLGTIQIERGSQATSYASYFTPIELAKIGTYQDRIYKDDGKWYIEKQVGKVVLDGSEWWGGGTSTGSPTMLYTYTSAIDSTGKWDEKVALSNNYTVIDTKIVTAYVTDSPAMSSFVSIASEQYFLRFMTPLTVASSVANFKTWLASNPTTVYYALATPTNTEITDETLLSQLNFIASLYGGVNNISIVGTGAQGEMEVLIRDVLDVETDVVPETPVRLTLTDGGVINACGCRRDVQLTMRETTE